MTRSADLPFFRTFAVPAIVERPAATGEFVERAGKRYDDTDLLISTFTEHGYSTPMGRAAIRRMNQLHRQPGLPVCPLHHPACGPRFAGVDIRAADRIEELGPSPPGTPMTAR